MRLPVLLNSNMQIQDQDGLILAKDVEVEFGGKVVTLINGMAFSEFDASKHVGVGDVLIKHDPLPALETNGNGSSLGSFNASEALEAIKILDNASIPEDLRVLPTKPEMGTALEASVKRGKKSKAFKEGVSERMKEYWRKKRELAKA